MKTIIEHDVEEEGAGLNTSREKSVSPSAKRPVSNGKNHLNLAVQTS